MKYELLKVERLNFETKLKIELLPLNNGSKNCLEKPWRYMCWTTKKIFHPRLPKKTLTFFSFSSCCKTLDLHFVQGFLCKNSFENIRN